ncbi:MAG: hypothetical protein ABI999_10180 [Acidobacteriota bacterium]
MFMILSVIVLAATGTALGQDDLFTPMKGTATPSFQMKNDSVRCLVFGTHIVKMTASEDGGENVSIWHREGTVRGTEACQVKAKPYATINDADNNSFYGISTDYFFIDSGTSVDSRIVYIYNTDSGTVVTQLGYQGDPSLVGGRFLMYDEPTDKKGPISTCPEAAKWKRQGGGVSWVQGKKMDLKTKAVTKIGTLRCVYME